MVWLETNVGIYTQLDRSDDRRLRPHSLPYYTEYVVISMVLNFYHDKIGDANKLEPHTRCPFWAPCYPSVTILPIFFQQFHFHLFNGLRTKFHSLITLLTSSPTSSSSLNTDCWFIFVLINMAETSKSSDVKHSATFESKMRKHQDQLSEYLLTP